MSDIYATFTPEGMPTGFYDTAVHGNEIPVEAIEITPEAWQELIDHQGHRRYDAASGRVVVYTPPAAPRPVPAFVPRAQAKLALLDAGYLAAAKQAVLEDTTGRLDILFNDRVNWYRDNPDVIAIGTSLGMSSADMDALFQRAEDIQA